MKLRIGSHRWTVSFKTVDIHEASHDMGGTLAGYCNKANHRIVVDEACGSPAFVREALLHEVLHACVEAVALDDILNGNEEPVVDRLAGVLIGVLRDNPKLVRYLLADEKSTKETTCPPAMRP